MGKYWWKCEKCGKKIKRELDFSGSLICLDCRRKLTNFRICLNCKKEFYSGKNARKYCSKKCSGEYLGKNILSGRTLSKKHKEALSKSACSNHNGYKVKYYKIFCPYHKKEITVQGTYELKYAQYLNSQCINWKRDKTINLQYKLDKDDIIRNYYPDFYLIDTQEYIEIKGYFYPKDIEKMKKVKEQHMNKKIIILFYEDLKNIGIFT
jgi:hypothetical protein